MPSVSVQASYYQLCGRDVKRIIFGDHLVPCLSKRVIYNAECSERFNRYQSCPRSVSMPDTDDEMRCCRMVCRQERVSIVDVCWHAAVGGRHWLAQSHWLYVTVQRSARWCCSLVLTPIFALLLGISLVCCIRFTCWFNSVDLKI